MPDDRDRRRTDEEIERTLEQMELVVRSADVGVWYCPLPFDELIWDAKVKEHFHLPPDARVTIDMFYERLHPDDRERTRAAIDRSITERATYDIDYRTCSPDGKHTKWIRAVGRGFYDAEGKPYRFDGVTKDISERKRSELAARANEERYRLATRATNDVVWDWDLTNDEVRWNEALTERFGHPLETAGTAAFWKDHVHPEDRARVERAIHAVIDDPAGETWQAEYRFLRADGSVADVIDRGWVIRDARGRGTRMIGAMQDRTEQKRIERERERVMEAERAARSEAERQNRMKDEFLATLSHELRTPLNAILGWSQLALADPHLGDKAKRALDVIVRNARAQARLVEDLLDMSGMLSGKVTLELSPVPLAPLAAEATETTRPTADAKGVRLVLDVPPDDDPQVRGDANRLQQVLWNLLSNAVKFTPRGGTVIVSVRANGGEALLEVTDDGEGIDEAFLPYVFDRFRQADGSITRTHGGLGLGLSLVKQVVELHGGRVEASSPGRGLGARFTVRLPRAS